MVKNENERKKTTSKVTESNQRNSSKFCWNKIIRIKADKSAVVKPIIACGVTVGAFALAIIIALIVLL